jgi:surface polysaccharide O-acyltransferase-like enzyme
MIEVRESKRDSAFDIVKGLSILEVIAHHVLSLSLRRFSEPETAEWWGLYILKEILHFAVPTFLMISALLLARSIVSQGKANWSRFYLRRLTRTVWPYLLWSAIYLWFRFAFMPEREHPNWNNIALYVFWGKAFYHLYFFTVLVQVSILFPIILGFVKKFDGSLAKWILIAFFIQLLIYYSNYAVAVLTDSTEGYLPFPASTLLWYVPPILLGAYIGVYWFDWESTWRRYKLTFALMAILGLFAYLWLEIRHVYSLPIEKRMHALSLTAYATSVSFLLIGFSRRIANIRMGAVVAGIGNRSLGMFVVHPAIIYLVIESPLAKLFNHTPLPYLWLWLVTVVITWIIVEVAYKLWIGKLLFGR